MRVKLEAIKKTVEAIQASPEEAYRDKVLEGTCNFNDGPHFEAVLDYPGGSVTLTSDQPPFLGGGGAAPDPLLYCLYGSAACFTGTIMTVIAQRELKVDSLKLTARNRVNLSRPLGLGDEPPVEMIVFTLTYTGQASEVEMKRALEETLRTCPAAYCLTNPIRLETEIKRG